MPQIFTRPDGNMVITHPNRNSPLPVEEIKAKAVFENARPLLVNVGTAYTGEQLALWRRNVHFDQDLNKEQERIKNGVTIQVKKYKTPTPTLNCREADPSEIPTSHCTDCSGTGIRGGIGCLECRYFRSAWTDTGASIDVDIAKSRVIELSRIREQRDKELIKQDGLLMKAVESKDVPESARITTLKQTLRDLPDTVNLDQYATPDDLKAAWPKELEKWGEWRRE